jgi:hypothetical protein
MYGDMQALQGAVVSNGRCKEGDDIGVCKACIRDADRFKDPALPSLFGKGNELDPGPVPSFLPTLTAVEELLIACIYIHLQVVHIRGQQYRYTGHVRCFARIHQRLGDSYHGYLLNLIY